MQSRSLLVAFISVCLFSCGGGVGGSGSVTIPSIGHFVDAPVGGLTYSCGALTGTTGSDGSFNYDSGTSCSFTIGNVTVGSVSAPPSDGNVTPYDLAGTTRTDALNSGAVAVAQFLQSIATTNASGALVIPTSVTTALNSASATSLLSNGIPVNSTVLQNLVTAATPSNPATLVSSAVAASNLATYISTAGISTTVAVSGSTSSSSSNKSAPNLSTSPGATLTAQDTTVGFSATTDIASTGYWELLPVSASAPSKFQIISGLDSNNNSVSFSGSSSMTAGTTTNFSISNLTYSTSYKLYFIASNASASGLTTSIVTSSLVTGSAPAAPNLTLSSSTLTSTNGTVTASITSDVASKGYWMVELASASAPGASYIISNTGNSAVTSGIPSVVAMTSGSLSLSAGTATNLSITGLSLKNNYVLYFVATNNSDTTKISTVSSETISVSNDNAPTLTLSNSTLNSINGTITATITSDITATGYYRAVVSTGSVPTASQIISNPDLGACCYNGGSGVIFTSGSVSLTAGIPAQVSITGLSTNASYTLYFTATNSYDTSKVSQVVTEPISVYSDIAPTLSLSNSTLHFNNNNLLTVTVTSDMPAVGYWVVGNDVQSETATNIISNGRSGNSAVSFAGGSVVNLALFSGTVSLGAGSNTITISLPRNSPFTALLPTYTLLFTSTNAGDSSQVSTVVSEPISIP